jgi:hypothetical protein
VDSITFQNQTHVYMSFFFLLLFGPRKSCNTSMSTTYESPCTCISMLLCENFVIKSIQNKFVAVLHFLRMNIHEFGKVAGVINCDFQDGGVEANYSTMEGCSPVKCTL